MVRQNFIFSVGSDRDDRAQYAGAVDQPMLSVEGIAVGITERNHFVFLSIGMEPVNLVDSFVAYIEKSRLVPHRAFCKPEARRHDAEFGAVIHQIPELR